MKNSKTLSTLALVAVVFVAWACGCPRNMNFNNSNNSNNSNNRNSNNSNNSNSSKNSNTTTVPSDFVTEFVVSKNSTGTPATTIFGSTDKIYITFSVRNMPAAKGLKGKLVADTVEGVQSGSSVDVTKDTKKGDTIRSYSFYFTPTPIWHLGNYHVELILINEDGTEGVLKSEDIAVS
jgi:hypothetical protein